MGAVLEKCNLRRVFEWIAEGANAIKFT